MKAETPTERDERAKLAELQREEDLASVMSTPAGRRFVARLIASAGIRKGSFTPDPSGRIDAFNEGRRDFGIKLEDALVAVVPRLWDQMLSEDRARVVNEQLMRPTPANTPK